MSLKNFHIFFISLSVLTSVGFGLWCFLSETGKRLSGSQVMGGISLAACLGLIVYGVLFIRKMGREGIR